MATAIRATFENGVLKPSKKLELDEHQQVLIVVVPLPPDVEYTPDNARVAQLREQAETWASEQPADAVRKPLVFAPESEQRLDDKLDAALAAIRARASRYNEEQIIADVQAAIAEMRILSTQERNRLDAEIRQVLADVAANVTLHRS